MSGPRGSRTLETTAPKTAAALPSSRTSGPGNPGQGLEPRSPRSERGVLPLDDPGMRRALAARSAPLVSRGTRRAASPGRLLGVHRHAVPAAQVDRRVVRMADRALRVQLGVANEPCPAAAAPLLRRQAAVPRLADARSDDGGSPRRPGRRGETRTRACVPCRGHATAARHAARARPAGRARAPGRRTTRPGGRTPRCGGGTDPSAASARPGRAQPSGCSACLRRRDAASRRGRSPGRRRRTSAARRGRRGTCSSPRRRGRAGAGAGRAAATSTTSTSTARPLPAKPIVEVLAARVRANVDARLARQWAGRR